MEPYQSCLSSLVSESPPVFRLAWCEDVEGARGWGAPVFFSKAAKPFCSFLIMRPRNEMSTYGEGQYRYIRHCALGMRTDDSEVGNAVLRLKASALGEGYSDGRSRRELDGEGKEGRRDEDKGKGEEHVGSEGS
jgi:hypothetical protein